MALVNRPYILFDITTGTFLNVLDLTGSFDPITNTGGYGSPNISAGSVNCTRYIFSSYLQEINASVSTTIVAGKEYAVSGSGSFTFDTKNYVAGDTFISMLSGTPTLSNCILTETGRFSSTSSFLPTQDGSVDLTPSLTIGESDLIYKDSSYSLEYSIYTTSYTAQGGIPAGTYVVYGTVGQTVTISGVTYRINEQFTQGGSFTMTGTGSIALLYQTTSVDQQISYYAQQAIIDMTQRVASSSCGCKDKLNAALLQMNSNYTAVENYFNSDMGTDFSNTQILLDEISSINATTCC